MAERSSFALRFRLFGIPVEVLPVFFVIAFLLGAIGDPKYLWVWVVVVFVFILLHELGHAVAARSFGSAARIQLYAGGGLTYHEAMPAGRSLIVTLAGPATGLAVGLPLWLLVDEGDYSGAVHAALVYGVYISLFWSLVNLLPILPLDGGNALQSILQLATGRPHVVLARRISIVTAVVIAAVAASRGYIFGAFYAVMFVGMNLTAIREHQERSSSVSQLQQHGTKLLATGEVDRGLAFITEGIERTGAIDHAVVTTAIATGTTEALAVRLRSLAYPGGGSWEPVFRHAVQQLGNDERAG